MSTTKDRTKEGTFAKGNRAAMSSGLAHGLGLTRLPKGCNLLGRHLSVLRRELEKAARASCHGDLTPIHHGIIATALSHERRRRLAERWLNVRWEKGDLTTDEFERLSNMIGHATEARDRTVFGLLGDQSKASPLFNLLAGMTSDPASPSPTGGDLADIETGEELARK